MRLNRDDIVPLDYDFPRWPRKPEPVSIYGHDGHTPDKGGKESHAEGNPNKLRPNRGSVRRRQEIKQAEESHGS